MSESMDLMKNKSAAGTNDGRVYWRSFEQLAKTEECRELLHREFPDHADAVPLPSDALSRRRFLGLVAAAVAMASTTSCRKPFQKILPFSKRPQGMSPGVPHWYATAFVMGGTGTGILVRSNDGRPTKKEGNDLHPSRHRGTDQYMQTEILNVFDQGRSRGPRHQGKPSSWAEFKSFWAGKAISSKRGAGLAFLMPATTSPSLIEMRAKAKEVFPEATFHSFEPINRDNELAGSTLAHGSPHSAQAHYERADCVVSLDADFTCQGPNAVRHARDFASKRKVSSPADKISRLYVIEANHSTTGTVADHRFRVAAGQIAEVAMALAAELNIGGGVAAACATHKGKFNKDGKDWVAIIAKDLQAHRGRSLVVAGEGQPPLVHALAHAINDALGNVGEGKPVTYVAAPEALGDQFRSIRDLAAKMDAGSVDTLVNLGTNPVYHAPADLDFAAKLAKVETKIHLGLWVDETAQACDWHLNQAHDLESWGDIRSHDGAVTIVQPLIAPLFDGWSILEALSLICHDKRGQTAKAGHGLVAHLWQEKLGGSFATAWEAALRDGLVAGTAYPSATPTVKLAAIKAAAGGHQPSAAPTAEALELVFAQDHGLYDGRYSNNPWAQELPDSVTKLTWDNAALMSKKTAEAFDIGNGDFVEISLGERKLEIPVWILPGCADFSVTLKLGYGRRLGDECEVAKGVGFDTYRLRTSAQPNIASGAKLRKTGAEHAFASTQDHGTMEGRALAREGTVGEYEANPDFAPAMSPLAMAAEVKSQHKLKHNPLSKPVTEKDLNKSLWEERDYSKGPQWAMVIDLNACNGCNACVVACQAENNIPTVGKERVLEGREMHWMRVDRYFGSGVGDEDGLPLTDDPKVIHQPVPCMQCENAPCESVCPVMATTHSPDGLNDMVYNRCIGTRYCSNNCPYKVRRFNYFDFTSQTPEVVKMVMNPDVTVRSRGVMEKCTYCVQRINQAKITARKDGERPVRDGEVTPACGQSCPSQAITFGDMLDPDSAVAKRRAEDHNYAMLSELNVKPRTTYLAKIRNPNTELGNS